MNKEVKEELFESFNEHLKVRGNIHTSIEKHQECLKELSTTSDDVIAYIKTNRKIAKAYEILSFYTKNTVNEKSYNEQLKVINGIRVSIKKHQEYLRELSTTSDDVKKYIKTSKKAGKAFEKFSQHTKDIVEFALNYPFPKSDDEPLIWFCDYYNSDDGKTMSVRTCRKDEKGTHRAYIGLESLSVTELTKEEADDFEKNNMVIVLDEYDNEKDKGIRLNTVAEQREDYFNDLFGDLRPKKRTRAR